MPLTLCLLIQRVVQSMDVARMDKPTSWAMLQNQINYVKSNPTICKTLVIDTIDWAEQLCIDDICATYSKKESKISDTATAMFTRKKASPLLEHT